MSLFTAVVTASNIGHVLDYFRSLEEKDKLKYRFPEVKDVSLNDVLAMLVDVRCKCFVVVENLDGVYKIRGEFMLNGFQGQAAQVHFSVHPDVYGKRALEITRQGLEDIRLMKKADQTPYITTLVGNTPVSNKLATRFITKIGYTRVGIVPRGFFLAYEDRYDDAYISIYDLLNDDNSGGDDGK